MIRRITRTPAFPLILFLALTGLLGFRLLWSPFHIGCTTDGYTAPVPPPKSLPAILLDKLPDYRFVANYFVQGATRDEAGEGLFFRYYFAISGNRVDGENALLIVRKSSWWWNWFSSQEPHRYFTMNRGKLHGLDPDRGTEPVVKRVADRFPMAEKDLALSGAFEQQVYLPLMKGVERKLNRALLMLRVLDFILVLFFVSLCAAILLILMQSPDLSRGLQVMGAFAMVTSAVVFFYLVDRHNQQGITICILCIVYAACACLCLFGPGLRRLTRVPLLLPSLFLFAGPVPWYYCLLYEYVVHYNDFDIYLFRYGLGILTLFGSFLLPPICYFIQARGKSIRPSSLEEADGGQ
jgi:hypothetical protein